MDIWLFAVAAGAGCVAQKWKKLRKSTQNLLDSSCRSPGCVFSEFLQTKRVVQDKNLLPYDALDENTVTEDCYSEREDVFVDTSMAEMASSSKPYEEDKTVNNEGVSIQGVNGVISTRDMGIFSGFTRKRKSLMCRRTNVQSLKPLTSLESCVMAQFHKEQGSMDDYNIRSLCSPRTPSSSPYILSRRNNVIRRTMTDAYSLLESESTISMDACPQETTSKSGVPQLPLIGSRRKSKVRLRTPRRRAKTIGHFLQGGSSDEVLIFLLGVSFGIMSSLWANKQEVDKLNGLLTTSENLVQDLQEELEMKETFTVKELAVEDYENQNDVVPRNVCSSLEENQDNGKAEEKCFSKIEAELEAELERLEMNMSSCRLGEKASDMVELDEDGYEPDIANGELKVQIFNQEDDPQPYADLDGSGSSPIHPADYAVSPRELSLRLHEVIQSRLELRVKELETELEMRRQSKDRFIESEEYWRRDFSKSNSESSSIQASPVLDAVEQQQLNQVDQSTIVTEKEKLEEEEEEQNTPFNSKGIIIDMQEERRYSWVYSPLLHNSIARNPLTDEKQKKEERRYSWVYSPRLHNSIARNPLTDEKQKKQEQEQPLLLFQAQEKGREEDGIFSLGFISSEEEEEDGSEEMEKLLIQHIVEQARKGSPVVLNAQKMLFSPVDDDDDQP